MPRIFEINTFLTVLWILPGCLLQTTTLSPIHDTGGSQSGNSGDFIRLDEPMNNHTKPVGGEVAFFCYISGSPRPEYRWFKDDQPIEENSPDNEKRRVKISNQQFGSRLKINEIWHQDKGQYKCVGSNPSGVSSTVGQLDLLPAVNSPSTQIVGIFPNPTGRPTAAQPTAGCMRYSGTQCPILQNRVIHIGSGQTPQSADSTIGHYLATARTALGNSTCYQQTRDGLCLYFMPLCTRSGGDISVSNVCREDCLAIYQQCIEPKFPIDFSDNLLPQCDQLTEAQADSSKCLHVGIIPGHPTNLPSLTGLQSTQPASHTPIEGSTSDPSVQKDKDRKDKDNKVDQDLAKVIGPAAGGLLVLIALIVGLCLCRRWRRSRSKHPHLQASASSKGVNGSSSIGTASSGLVSRYGPGPGTTGLLALEKGGRTAGAGQLVAAKDIPVSNVTMLQELGEGRYGKIYKGQAFGLYGNGTMSHVIVKTLCEHPPVEVTAEFYQEIEAGWALRHQHVVPLLGVCLGAVPQCILYEDLVMGDLHQFLITHSPLRNVKGVSSIGPGSSDTSSTCPLPSIQPKEVMYVATQVACGLEYLASQAYVHGDIAARNILVGPNLHAKVANLSVTLGMYSCDYYRMHGQHPVPLRWMAPEVALYGQCSPEGDVYSSGVLWWELFSYGARPYDGYSNAEVTEMIRARDLLPCPADCPPKVYSLMVECWHETPSKRPVAQEVHRRLRAWYLDSTTLYSLSGSTGAHSQTVSSPHTTTATHSVPPSQHSHGGSSVEGPASSNNPSNTTNLTDLRGSSGASDGLHQALLPSAPPQTPYLTNCTMPPGPALGEGAGIPGGVMGAASSGLPPYNQLQMSGREGANIASSEGVVSHRPASPSTSLNSSSKSSTRHGGGIMGGHGGIMGGYDAETSLLMREDQV